MTEKEGRWGLVSPELHIQLIRYITDKIQLTAYEREQVEKYIRQVEWYAEHFDTCSGVPEQSTAPEDWEVIARLHSLGLEVVMLTGDLLGHSQRPEEDN